jgi:hypothetical protein
MKSLKALVFILGLTSCFHSAAASQATDSCYSGISSHDVEILRSITMEVSQISADKSAAQVQADFESIIAKYEDQLSSAARQALIADFHERVFAALAKQLHTDTAFAKAYLNFGEMVQRFLDDRQKFLGGIRKVNLDTQKLRSAEDALITEIQSSSIDLTLKKELLIQVYFLTANCYQVEDRRVDDAIRQLSITEAAAGTVLSIDLIGLLLVTSGLSAGASAAVLTATGSSVAELLTGTAIATLSSAASGVGLNTFSDLAEIDGHAAVDQKSLDGFFCQVASSTDEQTPALLHQALISATVGGILGGGLKLGFTFLGKLPIAKKIPLSLIGKILGTGFRGIRIFEAFHDGTQIYELVKEGHAAEAAGVYRRRRNRLCNNGVVVLVVCAKKQDHGASSWLAANADF